MHMTHAQLPVGLRCVVLAGELCGEPNAAFGRFVLCYDGVVAEFERALWGVAGAPRIGFRCFSTPRPAPVAGGASITTLSDTDNNIFKLAAAAETRAGRSHQPRPDRLQGLFPGHTRSFFWCVRGP